MEISTVRFSYKQDTLYLTLTIEVLNFNFIKYKPVNHLTHAGTDKTVMTTFDNRNIWKNTL